MFIFKLLATRVAESRPYKPTIHVLVLPTQLPSDLRLNFRDLDEGEIVSTGHIRVSSQFSSFLVQNTDGVPDHMNILSSSDALQHVREFLIWQLYF
jgi:hypothetical protein